MKLISTLLNFLCCHAVLVPQLMCHRNPFPFNKVHRNQIVIEAENFAQYHAPSSIYQLHQIIHTFILSRVARKIIKFASQRKKNSNHHCPKFTNITASRLHLSVIQFCRIVSDTFCDSPGSVELDPTFGFGHLPSYCYRACSHQHYKRELIQGWLCLIISPLYCGTKPTKIVSQVIQIMWCPA